MKKNWKAFATIAGLTVAFATVAVTVFSGVTTTRAMAQASAGDPSVPSGCSVATVKGRYGLLGTGTVQGSPATVVGVLTPDGAGNFTYDYTENINGTVSSGSTSGTYTVKAGCSAIATFSNGGTLAGVIVSKGAEIDLMSTTPGLMETAVAKKIGL
jgi:hypothetical protein